MGKSSVNCACWPSLMTGWPSTSKNGPQARRVYPLPLIFNTPNKRPQKMNRSNSEAVFLWVYLAPHHTFFWRLWRLSPPPVQCSRRLFVDALHWKDLLWHLSQDLPKSTKRCGTREPPVRFSTMDIY